MAPALSIFLTLRVVLCLLQNTPTATADFYVSPHGSDAAAGTFEAPFATIGKAKQAVRQLKETKSGDILVLLRGGRYEFSATVVFGLEDSGSKTRSITYAAYPDERPILSAGKIVSNWKRPQQAILGLPKIASGKVMVADLTLSSRALFDHQGALPCARSKPFISADGSSRTEVRIPEQHFRSWRDPQNLDVVVRPHHAWIVNVLPVSKLNSKKRSLKVTVPATYAMSQLHFLKDTPNCTIENAIEELDEPGEWVLDRQQGKLYLWPRNESKVYTPQLP